METQETTKAKGLSKYAAKQQRLATDPSFGTVYEVAAEQAQISAQVVEAIKAKTEQRLAREAAEKAAAQPIDVAKVTAKIAAATADLHLLEAKIAKSRLNIERTLEVIKGQEAHAEVLRAAIDKLNGKLQLNAAEE